MQKTKELLQLIVQMIVTNREAIVVNAKTDERGVLMTLTVAKEDMGRIIGREGSMAKALRTFVNAIGMNENARVSLVITEPDGTIRQRENGN